MCKKILTLASLMVFLATAGIALVPSPAQSLIIYSGRSEELVGPIIDQFKNATRIDAKVRYAGTSELAATILEEGRRSPADIFFAQDPAQVRPGSPKQSAFHQNLSADATSADTCQPESRRRLPSQQGEGTQRQEPSQ